MSTVLTPQQLLDLANQKRREASKLAKSNTAGARQLMDEAEQLDFQAGVAMTAISNAEAARREPLSTASTLSHTFARRKMANGAKPVVAQPAAKQGWTLRIPRPSPAKIILSILLAIWFLVVLGETGYGWARLLGVGPQNAFFDKAFWEMGKYFLNEVLRKQGDLIFHVVFVLPTTCFFVGFFTCYITAYIANRRR